MGKRHEDEKGARPTFLKGYSVGWCVHVTEPRQVVKQNLLPVKADTTEVVKWPLSAAERSQKSSCTLTLMNRGGTIDVGIRHPASVASRYVVFSVRTLFVLKML